MPFEFMVALRFLREGRIQTLLILLGITMGVAVVVFISTVISALSNDIIARTLGTQAHIVVRPLDDINLRADWPGVVLADIQQRMQREETIDNWSRRLAAAAAIPGVTAAAAIASGPGFAGRGGVRKSVNLIGVELKDYLAIVDLRDKLVAGKLELPAGSVLLGSELALDLGVKISDRIRLVTESGELSFSVVGIIDFGAKELNKRWVLLGLRTAQSLLGLQLDATELYLQVDALFEANRIAEQVAARTGLQAESWMELNAQLLSALRSQNASSSMIRGFVMLSVALAIASVLVVSVVQKSAEIGVMRAYGVSAASIIWIFLMQGALLGLLGSMGGAGLAVGLVNGFRALALRFGQEFPATEVGFSLVLSTSLLAIVVGTIAALLPAVRAARMDPVQAMRNG